jgi:hypothetical protein
MRVFVAGATGAVGRRLPPLLLRRGMKSSRRMPGAREELGWTPRWPDWRNGFRKPFA